MKSKKCRLISIICTVAIIFSSLIPLNSWASQARLNIISAEFYPYDSEIRVLANVPDGYNMRLYIDGCEIEFSQYDYGESKLFVSKEFTASVCGIVPVKLEAVLDDHILYDTKNIKITKSFGKLLSFEEDFNTLDSVIMSDSTSSDVADMVKKLNDGQISISNIPSSSGGRFVDITDTYTPDSSSALTMRFHSSADKNLPAIAIDPSKDGSNGIIELSYDFISSNSCIRQTIYPVSRAYSSALTFKTNDGAQYSSSFRVVNYETFCFGSSDKKFKSNTWYNVRFLINLNELTFKFYINDELINYGSFVYNNSNIGSCIYGLNSFNISAGVQGLAGASSDKPVNVTFDNIRLAHTDTGASPSEFKYTLSETEHNTDILNANIPINAESITLGFDNAFSCSYSDIFIKKADGTVHESKVIIGEGSALSSNASRSTVTIVSDSSFDAGESYKILIAKTAKYKNSTYDCTTVIPFCANTLTSMNNEKDIVSLEKFETEVSPDYFSVVKQNSADSAAVIQKEIDGRKSAAFFFVANSNSDRKVILVQKKFDKLHTGRVVLKFDMYLAEENKNAELSISFGDGTYTFYPLDTAKQLSGGKINGASNPYYGWHNFMLIMDTVSQSSEMYFDGVKIGDTCYTIDNTYHKTDVSKPESMTGFNSITMSIWQAQEYLPGETYLGFAVDNWHVYREMPIPEFSSVTAYKKDGTSDNCVSGSLITADVNKFKLYIDNAVYTDNESFLENFVFSVNDKAFSCENVVFSDGILSFDVLSLPQNADIKFTIGSGTVLYDGVTLVGANRTFDLKTLDSNGLYHKKDILYNSTEVKGIFTLDSSAEKSVTLIVAAYDKDKLVSLTSENIVIDSLKTISLTAYGEGITGAKAFIWISVDALLPCTVDVYKGTGAAGTNALGLRSVFEKDSRALGYIEDAIVFKDDVNSVVFGGRKYKYENVSRGYPYTNENGTFMVPAEVFAKAFGAEIICDSSCVFLDTEYKTQVGLNEISSADKKIILDSPVEIKGNTLYVPLRSFAQDVLGFTYLKDRGMHIFDTETFKYTNSVSTYETKEPIDTIYRFMQFEHKYAQDIYAKMYTHLGGNIHPRILTNKKDLAKIKSDSLSDEVVSEALTNTLADADELMDTSYVEYYLPDGKRLLTAARNVMERLVTLSAAYLVTEDIKYADRAWEELQNCFAWRDWNTSQHYLDNSELLYGVAVAFDSFYDCYTSEQKKIIMDKTWDLSLKHTVERYQGINFSGSEWRTSRSNWGFVCNGAVISAILAFGMEDNIEYQHYYDYLLECALQAIEYPLMLYFPDGAWEEGMAYWEYSLRYLTGSALIPLYYSTGSTLDFMLPEGVKKIANMGLYMQSGNFGFNFSDNGDQGKKSSEAVYALAMLMNDDTLMQTWNFEMESMNATHGARTLMWYRPSDTGNSASASALAKDFFFRGVEVGSMKEEWYNSNGSVVFFKGGQNNTNGSHLDVGTFCFDSMGKRWSVDLGKDSYNIEGGYNGLPGWELYVKRPQGHNCVVINPRADVVGEYYGGQYLNGRAEITHMKSGSDVAFSVVDLSDAYRYDTDSYKRGFFLGDNRRTLVIQDEITLSKDDSNIYWFMHTRAEIEIDPDGKGAYLSQGDKKLRVDLITNADDAAFTINYVGGDIQRFPTDPVREGQLVGGSFTNVKVLTLECSGSENVYIIVKLTPVDDNYSSYSKIEYIPISNWTVANK